MTLNRILAIITMPIIFCIWNIWSIIHLDGCWKKGPGWGLAVRFLSLRGNVCVTLLSVFNLADLSMITGCDYYLSHIVNIPNVEDVSYLTEMDAATNLSGLHLRVKSGDHPYTYRVWPSSHGLWEAGWAADFRGKVSRARSCW